MVLHEHRRLGLRVAAPRDRADTGSVMRRIVRVGICVIAVGVIAAIAVAGAGSKTLKTTPVAARTASVFRIPVPRALVPRPVAPSVQVPQGAGVACPAATTSSSVCSAQPCVVFVHSAPSPSALVRAPAGATLKQRLHILRRQFPNGKIAKGPLLPKGIASAPPAGRARAPANTSCVGKARAVPRAIPISGP
jgi:hypothetical protein